MTSKVLYLDRIPCDWTEQKLRQALMPIGDVHKIVLLRRRNALFAGFDPRTLATIPSSTIQALVEAADLDVAARIVRVLQEAPLATAGSNEPIAVSYSKNQELRDRNVAGRHRQTAGGEGVKSNRILLITVQNPTYPITTDFVHGIFSVYGLVEKVVIFVKPIGLQCLVQFASLEEAIEARKTLNGLSIFPDCCGLVINYSNLPQELIVKENGLRSKDFLNPDLPEATNDEPVNPISEMKVTSVSRRQSRAESVEEVQSAPPSTARDDTSPVLLVCNLRESVTCDNLFNLFSCYGNVVRIKKLSAKPDHALIQFSSSAASQSALVHLRGFTLLGRSLEISVSKHTSIRPGSTADQESAWVKEYGLSLNRFTGKYANTTKHIYSPTKILHLSNFDDDISEQGLKSHLSSFHGGENVRVKVFASPSGQIQGLAEFPSLDAATNVLAQAHNTLLGTKRVKLAFSKHPFH